MIEGSIILLFILSILILSRFGLSFVFQSLPSEVSFFVAEEITVDSFTDLL